jgi:PAS domain S-box-containing protein
MYTHEQHRLRALADYDVLDTSPEEAFDRLTRLAAELFGAPIALVSLVDAERQWFKSRVGLDVTQTPRELAFCNHTIEVQPGSIFVVEDTMKDPRFATNLLVTGEPCIRFYAGAPITTPDGFNLGSICIIDRVPRCALTAQEASRLTLLAQIVVDELDLRRKNRLLNQKQRLLELAEAMSGVGSWRLRIPENTVEWSDEVYRIHDVTREAFDPNLDDALAFYGATERARVEQVIATAIQDKVGFSFQSRLMRHDGSIRDVICKAVCELGEDNSLVAIFGVFQDVTDSVSAISKAQRSEARYRLLADNMGDVVSRINRDGASSYISPAITTLLGYTPLEMQGHPAQAFVHPEDIAIVQEAIAGLGGDVSQTTLQHRAMRKDGSAVWVETNFQIVRDTSGDQEEMIAVIRDISARKDMEAELHLARAEAERAAAVKAEFLANMSHELRTPLTSVLGYSKLIAGQPELAPETRRFTKRLSTAGRLLLSTVNDILDFSRLEAGHLDIAPSATSPASCIGDTAMLMSEIARAKGLTLTVSDLGRLPPSVMIDADRTSQIVMNLTGNAVKFTDRGSVTVEAVHETGMLSVRIRDTGPGISMEGRAKLFQRFSQVDASSTRRHGGTGLGLAICKGLVEAMHGDIGVETAEGAGSVFWF